MVPSCQGLMICPEGRSSGSSQEPQTALQAWRSMKSDTCKKCATAPFDHRVLARWFDKVKERQPNFPRQFVTQSNKNEDRTLLAELKKHNILGMCEFSTFLHEHGCPAHEVFPPCRKCKALVKGHWKSDQEPYCSDTCARPPCADGCGAQRPQGRSNNYCLYHRWEGSGKLPWTTSHHDGDGGGGDDDDDCDDDDDHDDDHDDDDDDGDDDEDDDTDDADEDDTDEC